jgi:hypothetical protein
MFGEKNRAEWALVQNHDGVAAVEVLSFLLEVKYPEPQQTHQHFYAKLVFFWRKASNRGLETEYMR